MVPHHPEARFQSPAEMLAHYARVNARITSAAIRYEREREAKERKVIVEQNDKAIRSDVVAEIARAVRSPPRKIIAEIAAANGLDPRDLTGPSRKQPETRLRQEAMARVRRELPHLSLYRIGQYFGGRDHTTVLHAIRQVAARAASQPEERL